MDYDVVEERNIRAGTQFYTEDQLGFNKAEALQFNIHKWYNREIFILPERLTEDNVTTLGSQHLVIDCFDNYQSRELVQSFCKKFTVPCIHIGFSPDMTFAIEWATNYTTPSDIIKGMDICEMAGAAAFVNMVAALGALVVEEYVNNQLAWEFVGNKFTIKEIK
jgi:hypothetical protein